MYPGFDSVTGGVGGSPGLALGFLPPPADGHAQRGRGRFRVQPVPLAQAMYRLVRHCPSMTQEGAVERARDVDDRRDRHAQAEQEVAHRIAVVRVGGPLPHRRVQGPGGVEVRERARQLAAIGGDGAATAEEGAANGRTGRAVLLPLGVVHGVAVGDTVAASGDDPAHALGGTETRGVGQGDGIVLAVGVAVEGLALPGFQQRVDADEAASRGVVLAGAQVGRAPVRRVDGLAQEALVVLPGTGAARAGLAEGSEVALGDGLIGGGDSQRGGAVLVTGEVATRLSAPDLLVRIAMVEPATGVVPLGPGLGRAASCCRGGSRCSRGTGRSPRPCSGGSGGCRRRRRRTRWCCCPRRGCRGCPPRSRPGTGLAAPSGRSVVLPVVS